MLKIGVWLLGFGAPCLVSMRFFAQEEEWFQFSALACSYVLSACLMIHEAARSEYVGEFCTEEPKPEPSARPRRRNISCRVTQ